MTENIQPTATPDLPTAEVSGPTDTAPQWGAFAPKGGKTVVTRALKEGATVPLFLGQTLINSLRDLGYNSTTSAICEHVDNAIEAGATEVRVYFRQSGKQPNQRIDVLVYDNGVGMLPNVLKVAMAFGGSMRFDNRGGIGRYGMGMKTAALNLTKSVDVISWQEPGAFYTMSLDVDDIGKGKADMIALPDPLFSDALPGEVTTVFTKPSGFPKKTPDGNELFAADVDALGERLGKSGTIVYMPSCDRLTYKTEKSLVEDATKQMGRIYRRFIGQGLKLYINNRLVEAFDPTYWMTAARHTKVEGLIETQSLLVDSWTVDVPVIEGSPTTTPVRIRVFMLPVQSWSGLPRTTLNNALHVFDDHMVTYVRNGREVDIGAEPRLKLKKHHLNAWLRVEIEFTADADEGFGVAANKQGVRLKQYVVDAILDHDDRRFQRNITEIRKRIADKQHRAAATEQAGLPSEAERTATDADKIQQVSLVPPPTDTPEQRAALEANLRGLATSLRQDGETDEQAYQRVAASKYLTDFKHQEYAPFYDTEYKFGKVILRVNTAHPFYQRVWQPLSELAKKAGEIDEGEGKNEEVTEISRKALLGLQLTLLALARAQTQMIGADAQAEHLQLFKNLRVQWSSVLETQFTNL